MKNNDAEMNETFWNDEAMAPPNSLKPAGWILTTGTYEPAHDGVIFSFLQSCMAKCFASNAAQRFDRYTTKAMYANADCALDDAASKVQQANLVAGGKDTIDRAAKLTFWEWNFGSLSFIWHWQPEVKSEMRYGTPIVCK